MSIALVRTRFLPPGDNRFWTHAATFAICALVMFILVRGCGSPAQVPDRLFDPNNDRIPYLDIARSK